MAGELDDLDAIDAVVKRREDDDLAAIDKAVKTAPQPSTGSIWGDLQRGIVKSEFSSTAEGTEPSFMTKHVWDPLSRKMGWQTAEEYSKGMRDKLKAQGVDVNASQPASFAERVGKEIPAATEMGAATVVAGPVLAGVKGTSWVARTLRGMGEYATHNPVGAVAGNIAAVPGGMLGAEYGREGGEAIGESVGGETGKKIGGTVGEIGGGFAGGVVSGAPGAAIGSRIPYRIGQSALTERGALIERALGPKSRTPLLDEAAGVEAPQRFAYSQIDAYRRHVDNAITNISEQVADRRLTPGQTSTTLVRRLESLEREQNEVVNQAWSMVPRGEPVFPTSVRDEVDALRALQQTDLAAVPVAIMDRIEAMTNMLGRNGQPIGLRPITMGEILEFRSAISQARREASAGSMTTTPNAKLAANLGRLEEGIMTDIDRSSVLMHNPAMRYSLDYANHLTRIFHDRFSRGPVADVLGLHRSGADRIAVEDAAKYLMGKANGVRSVHEAGQPLWPDDPGLPGARQPQSGGFGHHFDAQGQMQRGSDAVMNEAIKQEYRDTIRRAMSEQGQLDPSKRAGAGARAGIKQAEDIAPADPILERQIGNYANAETTIRTTANQLSRHLNDLDAVEKSSFAAFTKREDPEQAVRSILNSARPGATAREVVQGVLRNGRDVMPGIGRATAAGPAGISSADAMAGLKTMIVSELRREGSGSAANMRQLWTSSRYQQVAREVFTPQETARIDRLTRLIEGAERGDRTSIQRMAHTAMQAAATYAGVHVGGVLAGALSFGASRYGALAFPAAFKRMFANRVQKAFDIEGADTLFSKALYDPKYEQQMLQKLPTVWQEASKYNTRMSRLMRGATGVGQ